MADAVVVPAIKIDLPADKALRLECLRLAAAGRKGVDDVATSEILAQANRFAIFVLAYTVDEETDAVRTGGAARG